MTWNMGESSRPPKRFCQVMPAKPASVFFACQALQRCTSSGVIPPSRNVGRPDAFGCAWVLRNVRASARNAASSGLSLKSMLRFPSGRVAGFEQIHEAILPESRTADTQAQLFRSTIIQVAVECPGEADAAMGLDVFLRR